MLQANELDALAVRYDPLHVVVTDTRHVSLEPVFRHLATSSVTTSWAKFALRMEPADPAWDRGVLAVEGVASPQLDILQLHIVGA